MPLYEYRCGDCGKSFEAFVSAQRTPACPSCQSVNLAKLLSSPGMVGAGSGQKQTSPSAPVGGCGMGTCGCRPDLN